MRKLFGSRSGNTTMIVLGAAAVVGMSSAVLSSLQTRSMETQASVAQLIFWNEAEKLVQLTVSNTRACLASFGGLVNLAAAPTSIDIPRLVRPRAGAADEDLVVAHNPSNGLLDITLTLDVGVPTTNPNHYPATLRMEATRTNVLKGQRSYRNKSVNFSFVAAAGVLTDCYGGFSLEEICTVQLAGQWNTANNPPCTLSWAEDGTSLMPTNAAMNLGVGTGKKSLTNKLEVNGTMALDNFILRVLPAATTGVPGQIWLEP